MKQREFISSYYTITKGYSEKISHEYYGGKKFETSDFFASHSYSWFNEPSVEEIETMSKLLYSRAVKDVEDAITKKKLQLKLKEMTPEEKKKAQQDEGELNFDLETQDDLEKDDIANGVIPNPEPKDDE